MHAGARATQPCSDEPDGQLTGQRRIGCMVCWNRPGLWTFSVLHTGYVRHLCKEPSPGHKSWSTEHVLTFFALVEPLCQGKYLVSYLELQTASHSMIHIELSDHEPTADTGPGHMMCWCWCVQRQHQLLALPHRSKYGQASGVQGCGITLH